MKLAEATELWLLELPNVVSVGSSSTLPRVASVTSSAPPSRNSVLQQQGRGRLLRRVAGLQGCVQDLEAVDVHRSCRLVGQAQSTPFGGAVKYILAVLQAPWSPAKLPYRGS